MLDERRLTCRQLVCETAKRPHVHWLRVEDALRDLRRVPIGCALTRVTEHLLIVKEDGKAEISNFNIAICTTEDVVRLYITMKNIILMHHFQPHRHVVECILAKGL